MSQSTSILLVCPTCKSRRQVSRELIGQRVQCRQCTAELTVDAPANNEDDLLLADEPIPSGAAKIPASSPAAITVDDIPLSPYAEPVTTEAQQAFNPDDDYRVGPVQATSPQLKEILHGTPPDDSLHADTWVAPPERITLVWTFTSGIFTYFLRLNALAQWMALSVGLFVCSWFLMMGSRYLFAGYGAIAGGCFCLIGFLVGIAAFSYGSACFISIIESTAYHLDKARSWPDSDYVEWLFYFLRLIYLVAVAGLLAALPSAITSLFNATSAVVVAAIAIYLLFPILLLSTLETNSSLWPVSPPILRSLIDDWYAWVVFFAISALLWGGSDLASEILNKYCPVFPLLITCMLFAATWFSYARLVGRLALYIMHFEEKPAR